jgi:hypothetical protein
MSNKQISSNSISFSNTDNLLNELPQIINNFDKMNIREIEPTTENINKYFSEELNNVVDELVNLIFKALNEWIVEKQIVLNFINDYKIELSELYSWLLNNQYNSNSIYLLGCFIYYGIGTTIDENKGYKLIQEAEILQNKVAEKHLMCLWPPPIVLEKYYAHTFNHSG